MSYMQRKEFKYVNPYDKHLGYRSVLLDAGPRFYMRTRHMLKVFPPNPHHIIDIGCGDGFLLELLAKKGFVADGFDGSAEAVKLCKKRLGNSIANIECCFIEDFRPQKLYDLLLCGEVLEHIEDDEFFLKEVNRLTVINGILIVTVPLDMSLWSKADEEAGHFRRYTKSEIFTKLQEAGFRVEKYVIWGFPLTRWLTPFIRKQQTQMMVTSKPEHAERKKALLTKCKSLLKLVRYIFLLDNLFNFTEKGVDIVIRARKTADCDKN